MSESTTTWGTVTAISPLRVKLDGDAAAPAFTPASLVDPLLLAVSDRVRLELYDGRMLIIGRSGGDPIAAALAAISLRDNPIGTYQARGDAVESGSWKLANGQQLVKADFPLAWAFYGTRFGAAPGSTFPLPLIPPGGSPVQARADVSVGTVTVVTATDVFTCNVAHGLVVGDLVYVNGGTLPTGMTALQVYAVKSVPSATTFTLSSTTDPNGTLLNLTAAGSGTRTLYNTTLKLDRIGGEQNHTQRREEVGDHVHGNDTRDYDFGSNPGGGGGLAALGAVSTTYRSNTWSTNANAAAMPMNNLPPFVAAHWFVRVA